MSSGTTASNPYVPSSATIPAPATPATTAPTTTAPTTSIPTTPATTTPTTQTEIPAGTPPGKVTDISDEILAQEKAFTEAMKAGSFSSRGELFKFALEKKEELRKAEEEAKTRHRDLYSKVKTGAVNFTAEDQINTWIGIVPSSGAIRTAINEIAISSSPDSYSKRDLEILDEQMAGWASRLKELSEASLAPESKSSSLFKMPLSATASRDSTARIMELQNLWNEQRAIGEKNKRSETLFESDRVTVTGIASRGDSGLPPAKKPAQMSTDEFYDYFYKSASVSASELAEQQTSGYGTLIDYKDYIGRWSEKAPIE